jgi:hypothetical protein
LVGVTAQLRGRRGIFVTINILGIVDEQFDDQREARREAEARQVAKELIQGYVGPDHKVINMQSFCSALVQALRAARMRGEDDAGDVLTLT